MDTRLHAENCCHIRSNMRNSTIQFTQCYDPIIQQSYVTYGKVVTHTRYPAGFQDPHPSCAIYVLAIMQRKIMSYRMYYGI